MGGTETLDTELYLARFRALAIFFAASSLDTANNRRSKSASHSSDAFRSLAQQIRAQKRARF